MAGYNRVCSSVRPLVHPLVTIASKTRLIDIFGQMIARVDLQGSLDASSHFFMMAHSSIYLSVYQSVCHASVHINFNKLKQE